MAIDRLTKRQLLKGGVGLLGSYVLPSVAQAESPSHDALFASAGTLSDGRFAAVIFDEFGNTLKTIALPNRGHDVVCDSQREKGVVFARRPGNFACAFFIKHHHEPIFFLASEGRHFYGHGTFSPDGRLLYATENNFEDASGVIGIYDATDQFKRIGEYSSYGVGPHEMLLMPDQKTLIIANGGIETHPDFGRKKLNIATMQPSIAFVDMKTGDLMERHIMAEAQRKLSIRHMDVHAKGQVIFGCQNVGANSPDVSMLGHVSLGEEAQLMTLGLEVNHMLGGYIGSVACSEAGSEMMATAPKNNVAIILDSRNGNVLKSFKAPNICGATNGNGHFSATASTALHQMGREPANLSFDPDNHVLVL